VAVAQHDRLMDVPDLVVSGAVTSEVQQAQIPDVVDARALAEASAPGTRGKAVAERLRHGLLSYSLGDNTLATKPAGNPRSQSMIARALGLD
jgi:hypothetical protein